MSSLFNYELDEQKIRLTLHDAALDYSDVSWTEFENQYPSETVKESVLARFDLPKINLNINRNVLIPIFFIIALGGVSAIMFKFIDFKPNKPAEIERALESNQASLTVPKKTVPPPVKEEPKQLATAPITEVKKDTVIPTPTVSVTQITNAFVPQKSEPVKQQYTEPIVTRRDQATEPSIVQRNISVPDTTNNAVQKTTVTANNGDKPPVHNIIYKNRRKKLVVEQVETIKAPSLMSAQNAAPEEEPELKIKQN